MTEESAQHIIVSVAPDGTISAETRGVTGTRCLDYVQVLEDLLDATTVDSAFTEEYSNVTIATSHQELNEVHQR
jgi:hypothetical protein